MNQSTDLETLQIYPQRRFKVYQHRQLDKIAPVQGLPESLRFAMRVVASVLPFRVNEYVINDLIDWQRVPEDPIFRLTFPQAKMLRPAAFERMAQLLRSGPSNEQVQQLAAQIRAQMNPHPAGQMSLNVPKQQGESLDGMQHKYKETLLFFPSQGQYCHSYCTFCFRWAQFVGRSLRFNSNDVAALHGYLSSHPEITDLLMTGGDPMVMRTEKLAQYLTPLLDSPSLAHVRSVRFGTKALTYWPYRFVTDEDADELLRLFERLVRAGKHVTVMAHLNHWREMETPIFEEAVRRIRATGANIRSQGPLLANINDSAEDWAQMWRRQVQLGIVPYYFFIERDTGPKHYFEVPLHRAYEIYRDAISQVSGLARTARGPSMSAGPGKVEIQGICEVAGEKVFVLRFLQARNPAWTYRPFFARYDTQAYWLDDLKPAFGEAQFFWQQEYEAMCAGSG
ncbi:KamA family radical SAM protein [Ferrimonas marina]|uniref:L-lysine 2,3-aminomutase n=1 Tax=Ferrimonas marina TaxID=299255 RepID=A0A1M5R6Q4_9GAMM|nr:lysine 2,3-aminomutase [Ferrimonas marina]SHH22064.1 L-lysine 2,3-aminomutase [Ferrimonas marina]